MADQKISELTEGNLILPDDDLVIVRAGANLMASLPPDATQAQAEGQTTDRLIWTPLRVRQAVLAHAPAVRTNAEIDTRANARITALVSNWARGVATSIPTNRLGNSVNYMQVWARSGNTSLIPLNKLTSAVNEAVARIESWARAANGSELIPLAKLGNVPARRTDAEIDARASALIINNVLPWALSSGVLVPLNQLPDNAAYRLGAWANNVAYRVGAIVDHGGEVWVADVANTNSEPTGSNSNWTSMGAGGGGGGTDTTLWQGQWASGRAYTVGQIVLGGTERWICKVSHISAPATSPRDGSAQWEQITGAFHYALQPRTATAINNVRSADIGVHAVDAGTANLPAGVTVGSDEAVLVVHGAQSGSSAEHRIKTLYILNKDSGATVHRAYMQFQDGPASQAASHSAWFRLDNAVNTPAPAFAVRDVTTGSGEDAVTVATDFLDITYKDSTGSDQRASVAVPAKFRGRVDNITLQWTGYTLTATYLDAAGATLGSNAAEIIFPAHTRAQWADSSRTGSTIISPQEAGRIITDRRPPSTPAAADAGADLGIYYGWAGSHVHRAARAALPKMTVAEGTAGTATDQRSLDAANLKAIIDALAPAGTNGRTALRKLYEDSDYVFGGVGFVREVAATKWKDYDALIISVRTAPSGETESSTGTDPLTSSGSVFLVDNLRRASVTTGGGGHAGAAQGQIRIVNFTARINAYQKGSVDVPATGEVLEGSDDNAFYLQIFQQLDAKVIVHGLRLEGAPTGDGWESIGSVRMQAIGSAGVTVVVPATGWSGYQNLMVFYDTSSDDDDESYQSYLSTPFPSAVLSLTSLLDNDGPLVTLTNRFITIDEAYAGARALIIARTTNTSDASDPASADHIIVQISGSWGSPGRLNVWGYNPPGSAAVVNAAAPYINYAHLNAPDLMAAYSLPTVYGSGDARATRANTPNWRKFQVGSDLFASSNRQDDGTPLGLPTNAGLTWRTGARSNVDHHVGETATGDLLPGTVFSLDGTWRLKCNITVDNLQAAGTRILLQLKKVVDANTSDDTVFVAHAGEIGSTGPVYETRSTTVPTGNAFYNNPATIQLVTPWYNYDPDDRWYILWALSRLDGSSQDGTAMRVRQAYLELEKRG